MLESVPRPRLTEEALRGNEEYTLTVDPEIVSATTERQSAGDNNDNDDAESVATNGAPGYAGMDDTCFSAFSAVPNSDMTRFTNYARSPTKQEHTSPLKHSNEVSVSRPTSRHTPNRSRRQPDEDYSSPTPRRPNMPHDSGNDTTNLLVDFTDQFYAYPHSSRRSPTREGRGSPTKSATQPDLSNHILGRGRTPSPAKFPLPLKTPNEGRHLANLLDFDLPPAPTPRSIPSISARELETMKSQFHAQISSLSASLSGKEAEVKSLKDAVADAERRVGEAQEQIRDERGTKEGLQAEKDELETRQAEMQKVLKDVKEEIIQGDREKDSLLQRVQEAEHRREEAEARIVEAESKLEGLKIGTVSTPQTNKGTGSSDTQTPNNEVEAAVTKVAKELHGLYKSKHEAKVTALKKSYSDRWEKKVRELTTKVDDLSKENEDLRLGRDTTMSGVVHTSANNERISPSKVTEKDSQVKTLESKVSTLENEVTALRTNLETSQSDNQSLQNDLGASRTEIADLIAASEELILLSQSQFDGSASTSTRPPSTEPPLMSSSNGADSNQRSFSRSTSGSGLKAPGFGAGGESRIGRMGSGGGASAITNGRDRSGSGLGRSGILSNIERMGRGP